MNPDQIAQVFGALGRIEQKIDNHTDWMEAHVKEDRLMAESIQKLQLAHARQRGFMTALAAVGGVISGLIGYAVEYFASGRAHH